MICWSAENCAEVQSSCSSKNFTLTFPMVSDHPKSLITWLMSLNHAHLLVLFCIRARKWCKLDVDMMKYIGIWVFNMFEALAWWDIRFDRFWFCLFRFFWEMAKWKFCSFGPIRITSDISHVGSCIIFIRVCTGISVFLTINHTWSTPHKHHRHDCMRLHHKHNAALAKCG